MTCIVTMPAVVAGATEAYLRVWQVARGDSVKKGDPLAEVETEKAAVDLESEVDGIVGRLLVAEGTSIDIGEPVAVLTAPGEGEEDIDRALAQGRADGGPSRGESGSGPRTTSPQPDSAGEDVAAGRPGGGTADVSSGRVFASPLARRRARELGLDLAEITGTGPGGRITRSDVEAVVPRHAESSVPDVPATGGAVYEDRPLTSMRRGIARRVTESKTTVPHFYLSGDVRVDRLLALRDEVNEALARSGRKASVNDLVLKAVAAALVEVPEANATWQHGEAVRYYRDVDVSMVMATDGGLLTPVVHDVAGRSLASVVDSTADLKHRAAHGEIKQSELEGGAFSLSNLGMFGTREFFAVVNPPQAGVVATGVAEQRPVVDDGLLGIATVMTTTISADHRIVDGATAARLLSAVQHHVENPMGLLL